MKKEKSEKKMNKIEEKFGKLQADLKSDYKGADLMLIKIYNVDELIESGFAQKNVETILKEVGDEDINDYFDRFVKDLRGTELGSVEVSDESHIITIGQFVGMIKRKSVYNYLNLELYKFLKELKGVDDGSK